jgi:phosphatidylinositol 3-kinase
MRCALSPFEHYRHLADILQELLVYLLQLVQALRFELQRITDIANYRGISDSPLANFLISRAASNFKLGNYFHWYLMVECQDETAGQDPVIRDLYKEVDFGFMAKLEETEEGRAYRKTLLRQAEMVTVLSNIAWETRNSRQSREKKATRLRQFLTDPKNDLITIDPPLPLFLDPSVEVTGCFPEESTCFKSTASPLKLQWKTTTGIRYPMIFKVGDDMRQDQLVIQIIMLMDRLLQSENLDLKLTPYHCLATAPTAGAVEFVLSSPLSDVDKHDKTILGYLRRHNPDSKAPLGIRKETMETYIKSCAGYCVITYILGVGDRHLDNLMLTPNGHFFHIDFSYILGRDPKPFATLMKLSSQMVDGMGGTNSDYYHQFKQYCFTAFTSLRKSANLILNLFALISEANIKDIQAEPDKAVLKVQERLHLDKSEQEATHLFDELIQTSTTAWAPKVIDTLHTFTQTLRG